MQRKAIRREVKHSIKNGLSKDELHVLRFIPSQLSSLEWKHSKEFKFKEQMYDIIYTEKTGDTIVYWCWLDHKENQLNKQLSSLLNYALGNDVNHKHNNQSIEKIKKSLYCIDLDSLVVLGQTLDSKTFSTYRFNLKTAYLSCISHPPEYSFI